MFSGIVQCDERRVVSQFEFQLAGAAPEAAYSGMANSEEKPATPLLTMPLMLPFRDKEGVGWHVVIRYAGHERRVDGFATEGEASEWIASKFNQVDK
jgi:hypothetical protein